MNRVTETPEWGFFALVSYIPDPLGSFLHQLREVMPCGAIPQPHITILPPRPLRLARNAASDLARNILTRFSAFTVELSKIRSFPETQVLYLDLAQGNELLHELHSVLNTGDLGHEERFEFRPHLTLTGAVPLSDLPSTKSKMEAAWHAVDCSRHFLLDEIVFLWLSPNGSQGEWARLWSHSLSRQEMTNNYLGLTAAFKAQTY
jgi:2'-5' RNA ligase superfamily protein